MGSFSRSYGHTASHETVVLTQEDSHKFLMNSFVIKLIAFSLMLIDYIGVIYDCDILKSFRSFCVSLICLAFSTGSSKDLQLEAILVAIASVSGNNSAPLLLFHSENQA